MPMIVFKLLCGLEMEENVTVEVELDEELRGPPSEYVESRNADLQMLLEESEAKNAPVDSV